jgi:uncharacterized protein YuzE
MKILENPATITWDYDDEGDVLYLSIGEPKPSIGVDIGGGVIVDYDEAQNEVAGLSIIGLRIRLLQELTDSNEAASPTQAGDAGAQA